MEHLKLYGEADGFSSGIYYVDQMLENHEFEELKGLLYFTDGYGIYRENAGIQDGICIYAGRLRDVDVIWAWALKLIIEESEMGGDTWI